MKVGSWKDPAIARDLIVLGALGAVVIFAAGMPPGLGWMLLGPVALGCVVAVLMSLRRPAPTIRGSHRHDGPHRGINMSRISLAGFPGLVFVLGFVWMFWHGLPGAGPIVVVAVGVVGGIAGLALVVIARWRRPKPASPLGLSDRGQSAEKE